MSLPELKNRIDAIRELEAKWRRSPMRAFGFSVVSTGDGERCDMRLRMRVLRYVAILIA
jgi:hypothetical protein